ncbi:hypothetical protein ABIE49_003682 [Bradyrhizobium sp. OAE829]
MTDGECDKTTRRANHFRFSEGVSSPGTENISVYQNCKSGAYVWPSRPTQKGVGRRHGRWAGCGGRWFTPRRRRGLSVRQNRVVLAPVAGVKLSEKRKRERQRRSQPRTRLRGDHGISRKAIAQGRPGVLRCPVCSCALCFVQSARETAGAARTRSSLRPQFERARKFLAKLGRNASRDREHAFSCHRPA